MLTRAGGSEERTVFLFSDTQIKDEGFVEDVNNLLNTGEIPNLFPAEVEMDIMSFMEDVINTMDVTLYTILYSII